VESKAYLANEARRLLEEPLIQAFIIEELDFCFESLKQMPPGATVDEWKTLQHETRAIVRFKDRLEGFIKENDYAKTIEGRVTV